MSEQRSADQLLKALDSTAEALREPDMDQIRGLLKDAAEFIREQEKRMYLLRCYADGNYP